MACDKLENLLLDEDENLAKNLNGTLVFASDNSSAGSGISCYLDVKDSISLSTSSASPSPPTTPVILSGASPRLGISGSGNFKSATGSCDVKFEVIDTSIVGENKTKHVEYTILLMNTVGLDTMPAKIVKRYSQLNTLRRDLMNIDRNFISSISFPSKKLIGNFTNVTLQERSKAFENFLINVFSHKKLRFSRIFVNFLYGADVVEGYRLIENGLYERAAELLISSWKVQAKVYPLKCIHSALLLIGIVACYYSYNDFEQANMYADLAIQNFPEPLAAIKSVLSSSSPSPIASSSSPTAKIFKSSVSSPSSSSSSLTKSSLNTVFETWFIPLLKTNIKIGSSLAKSRKPHEQKIVHLHKLGYNVTTTESLLELILHNKKQWIEIVLGDFDRTDTNS
ncbi:hypothetical protein HELRODRAFT_110329 [Helobdella robusta]|uniref:PX domain-containing protein n=1 Tax=Helobdella robusta TaxID=6412 RepID=T1EF15_HELRO|nr:hypothetical protein HELRODRAFT_110329 [Helobdella robusta]ESO08084.1 hypothetical protein HELRODRAFT_110329 [Helobdella robusta]